MIGRLDRLLVAPGLDTLNLLASDVAVQQLAADEKTLIQFTCQVYSRRRAITSACYRRAQLVSASHGRRMMAAGESAWGKQQQSTEAQAD
jgi:hypothetical protein